MELPGTAWQFLELLETFRGWSGLLGATRNSSRRSEQPRTALSCSKLLRADKSCLGLLRAARGCSRLFGAVQSYSGLLKAARSCSELPGDDLSLLLLAAFGSLWLLGAAWNCSELLKAARSCSVLLETARSCSKLLGADQSCSGLLCLCFESSLVGPRFLCTHPSMPRLVITHWGWYFPWGSLRYLL